MARKIIFASGKGGVGKSSLTAGIAIALCEIGFKTLVIDFDIGMGCLDLILAADDTGIFNWGDVVNGICEPETALRSTIGPKLLVAPTANDDSFTSDSVRKMIASYDRDFDYILFDAPAGVSGGFLLAAEGSQCNGCEGHDLDHNEHVEHVTGANQTQNGTGEHQEESVVVTQVMVAFHVAYGEDGTQQEGGNNHDREEQVQLVDLVADTDGIAANRCPVTHPVADDLAAEEDRFDQAVNEDGCDGSGRNSDGVANGFVVCAEDLNEEGAQEQQHDCHYRKVNVRNHYPCSPLTSSAFLVLCCL